jgi:iron complex outermembrane receptor protein
MKQFFSLFMLCMCCTIAFAQNRQIKGKVTDETGAGLAGVSVLLSGANSGVQTDANGNFSIAAPGTGAVTLTISYSGYKSQTIKTDGKLELSISLEKDVTALEDVVVIGYGTIKRKDLTGTVSSIGLPNYQRYRLPVQQKQLRVAYPVYRLLQPMVHPVRKL